MAELGITNKCLGIQIAKQTRTPLHMIRPDIVRGIDGKFYVVEIETMIGGMGMATNLRFQHKAQGFAGIPYIYRELLHNVFHDFHRPEPTELTVGVIIPGPKAFYDQDFDKLAHHLASSGVTMICVRPEVIKIRSTHEVWAGDQKLDAIHRFFRMSELDKKSRRVLESIALDRHVPMIQPWIEILEEKALMALLHNGELENFWCDTLGIEIFSMLRDAIPQTLIVTEDHLATLQSTRSSERPFWLKQSSNTWGGRGVCFGSMVTNKRWRSILETAVADHRSGMLWTLQDNVQPQPENIDYIEDDTTMTMTGYSRFNPFLIETSGGPKLADIRLTVRKNPKVHGATDACFLPVTICGL